MVKSHPRGAVKVPQTDGGRDRWSYDRGLIGSKGKGVKRTQGIRLRLLSLGLIGYRNSSLTNSIMFALPYW